MTFPPSRRPGIPAGRAGRRGHAGGRFESSEAARPRRLAPHGTRAGQTGLEAETGDFRGPFHRFRRVPDGPDRWRDGCEAGATPPLCRVGLGRGGAFFPGGRPVGEGVRTDQRHRARPDRTRPVAFQPLRESLDFGHTDCRASPRLLALFLRPPASRPGGSVRVGTLVPGVGVCPAPSRLSPATGTPATHHAPPCQTGSRRRHDLLRHRLRCRGRSLG